MLIRMRKENPAFHGACAAACVCVLHGAFIHAGGVAVCSAVCAAKRDAVSLTLSCRGGGPSPASTSSTMIAGDVGLGGMVGSWSDMLVCAPSQHLPVGRTAGCAHLQNSHSDMSITVLLTTRTSLNNTHEEADQMRAPISSIVPQAHPPACCGLTRAPLSRVSKPRSQLIWKQQLFEARH
jgi:hypothetical protein